MEISEIIEKLVGYAEHKLGGEPRDRIYRRNTLFFLLGLPGEEGGESRWEGETLPELLSALAEEGIRCGALSEEGKEGMLDAVMGALMLPPSAVEREFSRRYAESAKSATDWLYAYSVASDYVKKDKLDRNPRFTGENGLIVTINLSKPEFRDPKKAVAGNSVQGGYPKCSICRENEGYAGRAKRTLRTVSVRLRDEKWFWQYSPYGYFREHGIAVNERHIPMHVDLETFYKLMEFADAFPHYFIGCNAPLPRIGGSVLAHDHFQGGGERLPLFDAKVAIPLRHPAHPDVSAGVLDWFGTVVSVEGKDPSSIAAVCEIVRKAWENYADPARGLIPLDENGAHHAVSPTVVKTADGYRMNLILRSNITSEQYPDGVFHAHPEFHVIKKESIGLIEAQGLFILPGRLKEELKALEVALGKGELPASLSDFSLLFREILEREDVSTPERADRAIGRELASICERILLNTAVFERKEDTAKFLRENGFYGG